jgi:hypothetical protein
MSITVSTASLVPDSRRGRRGLNQTATNLLGAEHQGGELDPALVMLVDSDSDHDADDMEYHHHHSGDSMYDAGPSLVVTPVPGEPSPACQVEKEPLEWTGRRKARRSPRAGDSSSCSSAMQSPRWNAGALTTEVVLRKGGRRAVQQTSARAFASLSADPRLPRMDVNLDASLVDDSQLLSPSSVSQMHLNDSTAHDSYLRSGTQYAVPCANSPSPQCDVEKQPLMWIGRRKAKRTQRAGDDPSRMSTTPMDIGNDTSSAGELEGTSSCASSLPTSPRFTRGGNATPRREALNRSTANESPAGRRRGPLDVNNAGSSLCDDAGLSVTAISRVQVDSDDSDGGEDHAHVPLRPLVSPARSALRRGGPLRSPVASTVGGAKPAQSKLSVMLGASHSVCEPSTAPMSIIHDDEDNSYALPTAAIGAAVGLRVCANESLSAYPPRAGQVDLNNAVSLCQEGTESVSADADDAATLPTTQTYGKRLIPAGSALRCGAPYSPLASVYSKAVKPEPTAEDGHDEPVPRLTVDDVEPIDDYDTSTAEDRTDRADSSVVMISAAESLSELLPTRAVGPSAVAADDEDGVHVELAVVYSTGAPLRPRSAGRSGPNRAPLASLVTVHDDETSAAPIGLAKLTAAPPAFHASPNAFMPLTQFLDMPETVQPKRPSHGSMVGPEADTTYGPLCYAPCETNGEHDGDTSTIVIGSEQFESAMSDDVDCEENTALALEEDEEMPIPDVDQTLKEGGFDSDDDENQEEFGDGDESVEHPVTTLFEALGVCCAIHRRVPLAGIEQNAVFPYTQRRQCSAIIDGERCGRSVGALYVCTHRGEAGSEDCGYALCSQHFAPTTWQQRLSARMLTMQRDARRLRQQWRHTLAMVVMYAAAIAYVPVLTVCYLVLSCNPRYRCGVLVQGEKCWEKPSALFYSTAMVAILIVIVYGFGLPCVLLYRLRCRQRFLRRIFVASRYQGMFTFATAPSATVVETQQHLKEETVVGRVRDALVRTLRCGRAPVIPPRTRLTDGMGGPPNFGLRSMTYLHSSSLSRSMETSAPRIAAETIVDPREYERFAASDTTVLHTVFGAAYSFEAFPRAVALAFARILLLAAPTVVDAGGIGQLVAMTAGEVVFFVLAALLDAPLSGWHLAAVALSSVHQFAFIGLYAVHQMTTSDRDRVAAVMVNVTYLYILIAALFAAVASCEISYADARYERRVKAMFGKLRGLVLRLADAQLYSEELSDVR